MPRPVTCKICLAPNQAQIEEWGKQALAGRMSWSEIARNMGIADGRSVQNHMERHYVERVVQEAEDELDTLVADAIADLQHQMQMSPPEVKPLYAAAIVNLRGLKHTKPSQSHLIQALKTIQEMTGMRNEQRVLLQFAEAMFGPRPIPVEAIPAKALEAPEGGENE